MKSKNLQNIDNSTQNIFDKILEKVQISKSIKIFESKEVGLPVVIGFLKPVILLPIGLATGLSARQIEIILAHEIAHIKRHDFLFNLFQSFVEILFFFHPAIWWLSGKIREEREHACDDFAIEFSGDKMLLINTLAMVESLRQEPVLAMAFGRRKQKLLLRIKRILNVLPQKNQSFTGILGASFILVLIGFMMFFKPIESIAKRKFENILPIQSQNEKMPIKEDVEPIKDEPKPAKLDREALNLSFDRIKNAMYNFAPKIDTLGDKHYFQYRDNGNKIWVDKNGNTYRNGVLQANSEENRLKIVKHLRELDVLEKEMEKYSSKMELQSKEMEKFSKNMEFHSPDMEDFGKQMEKLGKDIEDLTFNELKYSRDLRDLDANSASYKAIQKK